MPTLHPYPAYQPSGVPWLGDVPAHWEVRRLKGNVANITDPARELDPGGMYVALEHIESWTGRIRDAGNDVSFDSQVKHFQAGDVLFGKLRPYLAKVTYPNCSGVCVSELLVLRPRTADLSPSYLERLLRSKGVIDAIDASTFGAKMPRADWQFIGNMQYPVPPLSEQAAIVRYLDYADRRIRRYLTAKQKLIALLEEEKQAVINQAVTRGLVPYVHLKPSSVPGLGDVPAHWEVRRLKTLCSMKSGEGITTESIETMGEYPVYGGNGLRGYASNYTHNGDFTLIGRQGALCGNVHIARGRFWASEHAVVATLHPGHVIEWFGAILRVMNLNQYSIAAAQPGLSVERVLNLYLPVPPMQEQESIANYIEDNTTAIDAAIARAGRQIELLQEYRTRLIADVVTGQRDVRAAAARLPEAGGPEDYGDAEAIDKPGRIRDNIDNDPEAAGPPARENEVIV